MDDRAVEFFIGYEGANNSWWVYSSYPDLLEYRLSFESREAAYHHSKIAAYEFNLIRLKHQRDEEN